MDGFFAVKRTRFGCPPTLAEKELIICPFLPDSIGLKPEEGEDDFIGGVEGLEYLPSLSSSNPSSSKATNSDSVSADLQTPRTKTFELLTPALLPPGDWPFSVSDLMQLALGPPSMRYPLNASPALFVPPLGYGISGSTYSSSTYSPVSTYTTDKRIDSNVDADSSIMSSREAYALLFQCGVETVKAWAKTVDITQYSSQTQKVDTMQTKTLDTL